MSHSLVTPLLVTLPVSCIRPRKAISGLHHRHFSDNRYPLSPLSTLSLSSRPTQCSVSLLPSEKLTSDFLDVELLVRDCELDEYGVVNNVVYASYCQHARQELLDEVGISVDAIARNREAMAISDLSFKFFAPLRSGDKFVVSIRVTNRSATRLNVEHYIYKLPNREAVLEAKATVVWLDKNYRPGRMPSEIRSKLTEFRRHHYPN